MIQALTREAEVGKIYLGTVRKIAEFGAFVEIFPGTDGLIHISELSDKRVKSVSDVLKEGDEVMVKVICDRPDREDPALAQGGAGRARRHRRAADCWRVRQRGSEGESLRLTAETGRIGRSSLALAADPVVARRLRGAHPAPSSLLRLGRDCGAILGTDPTRLRRVASGADGRMRRMRDLRPLRSPRTS